MGISYYNINNSNYFRHRHPSFMSDTVNAGILSKPIETVQKTIETGVDTVIGQTNDDKKKKRRKRAIAAGSAVLVLGALTMFLNPKSSGKVLDKLKNLQLNLDRKIAESKDSFFKSKFYSFCKKIFGGAEKCGNVYFNINSGKDVAFKTLCTNSNKKYPEFLTKNKTVHNIVKTVDDGFVKIFKKPHKKITKWFDNISRWTVKKKYQNAASSMNKYEEIIKSFKDKLPTEKRKIIESKLKEIVEARKAFSETEILNRLNKQESIMGTLEKDLWEKIYNKKDGFAKDSTSFWVRDILKPKKAVVEKEGKELVDKLVGKNGLYDDTLKIFKDHLSEEEFKTLNKGLNNVGKKLKKANISECVEYFDKKRDLLVGSAPTDIVTQLAGVGLCGWAVSRADKEQRMQKLFTTGLPIITGLGSSLVFSALLYSGGVGLLAGAAVGGVTTLVCNYINKNVFGNKDKDEKDAKEQQKNRQEIKQPEVRYV